MFRIGVFARLAGVSVRTLHHYEALGLLHPAVVSESGVRFYAPGQLDTLSRIIGLKAIGLTLEETRTVVQGDLNEPYSLFLLHKRAELLARRETLDQQLARLNAELDKEKLMAKYTVHLKTAPALRALVARGSAPDYRHVAAPMGALYQAVCAVMAQQRLTDAGWSVVTWHGGGYQSEERIELEVALPLYDEGPIPGHPDVTVEDHPELLVASTLHLGSYRQFGEAYAAVLSWMDRAGFVPVGPVREVYLRSGQTEDEHISEVQIPVRRL